LTGRNKKAPGKRRVLFDLAAFKHPPFPLVTMGIFFAMAGLYIPTFYVSSFAIQKASIDTNLAFYMLPILNAGAVVGRILPGFFAWKTGPLNVQIPTFAAAAVFSFGWIGATNLAGLTIISLLFGYCSGTALALMAPTIGSLVPSIDVLGTWTGTSLSVAGLGILIGTPVAGVIVQNGNWIALQVWGAVLLSMASVFFLAARFAKTGLKFWVSA
jgi:predicted MFS family arabinose efflux permease